MNSNSGASQNTSKNNKLVTELLVPGLKRYRTHIYFTFRSFMYNENLHDVYNRNSYDSIFFCYFSFRVYEHF